MEGNQLAEMIGQAVAAAFAASGGAAWLSTFLSDKSKTPLGKALMAFLNTLGGNVGKAKNDAAAQ